MRPYEIPYQVLLPKRTEAENLLVPVCCSASHVAYSKLRMEPVFMMLGQACGAAAAACLERGIDVHDLPPEDLRRLLAADGQVLDARPFTEPWPRTRPR